MDNWIHLTWQVCKYIKLALADAPHLAEYIISNLPSAEDLLPPDLLVKIPQLDKDCRPKPTTSNAATQTTNWIQTPPAEPMPHLSAFLSAATSTAAYTPTSCGTPLISGNPLTSTMLSQKMLTPSQLNRQLSAAWENEGLMTSDDLLDSLAQEYWNTSTSSHLKPP